MKKTNKVIYSILRHKDAEQVSIDTLEHIESLNEDDLSIFFELLKKIN